MDKIRITVFPAVPRAESVAVRINPDTYSRIGELAESIELSYSRVADYLLNEALDRVQLSFLHREDDEQ